MFIRFQRDANPEKFQSRLFNKTQYAKIGLQKMFFERTCKDLWKRIEVEVRIRDFASCIMLLVVCDIMNLDILFAWIVPAGK